MKGAGPADLSSGRKVSSTAVAAAKGISMSTVSYLEIIPGHLAWHTAALPSSVEGPT